MSKENSYLGKIIQISNSKIGVQLAQKQDPLFEMNYESLFSSSNGMLTSLARKTSADIDKTKFLSSVYSLGKVAGGDYTLQYVNDGITSTSSKLNEMDIMFQNLQTVFPDLQQRFTQEDLMEFAQLYSKNPLTKETKIVKTIYHLNMIMQYYKNNGNNDNMDIVDFGFDRINEMANQYNLTGNFDLNPKLKQMVSELGKRALTFSDDEKSYLDKSILKYNSGEISKGNLINELNEFRIQMEKKTKVR